MKARLNPTLAFLSVSGRGAVAYMLRPGMIVPKDGITSRTGWYNWETRDINSL